MRATARYVELQWRLHPRLMLRAATVSCAVAIAVALVPAMLIGSWWLVPVAALVLPLVGYGVWLARHVHAFAADPLAEDVEFDTDRLTIRRLQRTDADVFAASIDGDVQHANGWTSQHRQLAVQMVRLRDEVGRRGRLVAVDRTSGEAVAFLGITDRAPGPEGWHIGLWVHPAWRGQGFASEALGGAFELAHRSGIDPVYVGTDERNQPMRTAIENAGATLIGCEPHVLPNEDPVTAAWYRSGAAPAGG